MVLRKSSLTQGGLLPYPISPASTQLSRTSPQLPSMQNPAASSYGDQANPWQDRNPSKYGLNKPLPPGLQPGPTLAAANTVQHSEDLLNVPKRGSNGNMTPRSSFGSQTSENSWDDIDGDARAGTAAWGNDTADADGANDAAADRYKRSSVGAAAVRRKPVASPVPEPPARARSASYELASNNPFRQLSPSHTGQSNSGIEEVDDWTDLANGRITHEDKGKQVVRDPQPGETPVQMTANLSLDDRPFEEYSSSYRPSNLNLNSTYHAHEHRSSGEVAHIPQQPSAPPPPVPQQGKGFSEQPPLIPIEPDPTIEQKAWSSEKLPMQDGPPGYENVAGQMYGDMKHSNPYQEQETGVVDGPGPAPQYAPPYPDPNHLVGLESKSRPPLPQRPMQPDLLGDEEETYAAPDHPPPNFAPPKPPRPIAAPPPKPPRPRIQSTSVSDEQVARMYEQRNETYQIKHFNWFDHNTNFLRRSSMLTQNKNGPCPLLALVNALILSKQQEGDSALTEALQAREQVSLGLLIESLMDELTSKGPGGELEELPDVDELNRFLCMLHTGMNANPRFVTSETPAPNLMDARNSMLSIPMTLNVDRKPGTFEPTQDMLLYGAFGVPLLHGWLPSKSDPAKAAFTRAAPTYEDAQTILFGEEELEGKLSQGGLSREEQQLWEDIVAVRTFLSKNSTQLTPFGLNVVSESLFPGSFAIMFRNDHFSTVYKHPDSGQIFTLVTDAGYAEKDEVIWESLVDVTGKNSEFYSGDFRPVGGPSDQPPSSPSGSRQTSTLHLPSSSSAAAPLSPQETQEQHDADFAMALQLQEEEEQRVNGARRRATQSTSQSNSRPRTSNIPIQLASEGPAIPPRVQRNPGVNRPTAATEADDGPPPYEEATKAPSYVPPPGHPQHPSSDPSPRASTTGLNPISPIASTSAMTPAQSRPQPQRTQPQRRMSAFHENAQLYGNARPQFQRPASGPLTRRQKDEDRECVVM